MCLLTYSRKTEYSSKKKLDGFTGSPKWAYVEITSKCSHKCKWCYGGFDADLTNEMSLEDFTILLDRFKQLGITQITLSGGEPTEHSRFDAILEVAGKDFILNLVTHGDWLDENLTPKLVKANVKQVQFNYQGSKNHDSVHGVPGAYAKQLKSIIAVAKSPIEAVCCLTVGKYNLSQTESIFNEMVDLGVTRLRVWETTGFGNSFRQNLEAKEIFDKTTELANKLGFNYLQSYDPLVEGDVGVACLALSKLFMYVNYKGEHIFCGAVPSQLDKPISNLITDSIEDIHIHHDAFVKLHTRDKPYCMAREDTGKPITISVSEITKAV